MLKSSSTALEKWLNHPLVDNLDTELKKLASSELESSFDGYAQFGTGGIRSIMGPGTNRLNVYTIARASEGLANYILKTVKKNRRLVVISYDTRLNSKKFANVAASTFLAHNIPVLLSDMARPTPELSFMVRYFKAAIGIMITASHNPYIYNGYKVYDQDGGQITLKQASDISDYINSINNELDLSVDCHELYKVKYIGNEIDKAYLDKVKSVTLDKKIVSHYGKDLKIVYTPLNGTGKYLVVNALKQVGFTNLILVKEQSLEDPYFCSVDIPNPEFHETFSLGTRLGEAISADVIIATDPDSDRLGIAVNTNNGFVYLNGNTLGAILTSYLIEHIPKKDRSKYKLVKTIVTSDFGKTIASHHGIETLETLTGFKYIGELAGKIENNDAKFLLGYEESFGYLSDSFVRDKDGIQGAVLACEVALYCKEKNITLVDYLTRLQEKYGYFNDKLLSYKYNSISEEKTILDRVDKIRTQKPRTIAGLKCKSFEDYLSSKKENVLDNSEKQIALPKSNVLKVIFDDNSWIAIRPSGTEPKIKIYISVKDKNKERSNIKMLKLVNWTKTNLFKK